MLLFYVVWLVLQKWLATMRGVVFVKEVSNGGQTFTMASKQHSTDTGRRINDVLSVGMIDANSTH